LGTNLLGMTRAWPGFTGNLSKIENAVADSTINSLSSSPLKNGLISSLLLFKVV
jgi:hypothetical protein